MGEAVIVSAVRTAIGGFQGSLGTVGATDLGGRVIAEAVRRAGIAPDAVNEVIMGQVLPLGYGQNPARQAAVKAGLPWEAESLTINKVCGSGLKAVMLASQAIQAGDAEVVVAGGMENMSLAPHYLEKSRSGYRMGHGVLKDHMINDGLWDIVNDFHMGISNDLCAEKYGISREDQDRYAAESYRRAIAAREAGRFAAEILPVEVPQRKGPPLVFERDECPRETPYEALAAMKPAFQKTGTATAGNASVIADGAAAVVVMSRAKAEALGCRVLARVGAQASYGIDMKYVLVAPIGAVPKCLAKQGIGVGDVDLFEINEAFSGSTVAVIRELGLDPARVNVNGGAVALGHPIGASGCRVLVTLIHELIRQEKKTGLASLCLGGGEAVALVVTR
jgi:acetyl-CoA C-acetyltransferase